MKRRIVFATFAAFVLASVVTGDASAADDEPPARARVRVHVRLQRQKDAADVLVERGKTWTLACRAPCTFDGVAGEEVRVDMEGLITEPLRFTVPADGSTEHEIEIRRRGEGLFVGGLAAIGAGAVSLALGMAIIRGAGREDLFGEANFAVATVAMLLGAASAVTGTVLILRRSTEPFIAPVMPSRSSEMAGAARAAPPQLVWTVRF